MNSRAKVLVVQYMHGTGYDDMLLAMELGKEEAANGTEIEKV